MTWKEIQVIILGHDRREINEWRRARFEGYMQYLASTGDKVKKSVYDFMPLPGDPKREKGEPVDPDELVKRITKMYGGRNITA